MTLTATFLRYENADSTVELTCNRFPLREGTPVLAGAFISPSLRSLCALVRLLGLLAGATPTTS